MSIRPSDYRWPTLKESALVAGLVSLIGFFCLHAYYPRLGIIGNAMNGSIVLTDNCSTGFENGRYDPKKDPTNLQFEPEAQPFYCGAHFSYRWLLISMIVFVAACWYREAKAKKP